MRMLFEVNDLLVASPATVSRCGMVYLTPEELGWRPYVQTWIATFFTDDYVMTPKMKEFLWSTFEATIDPALEFVRQNCKEAIRTTDLQQVTSICNYIEGFIDVKQGFKGTEEEKLPLLNCLFAWSYAWGIGGSLDQAGKDRFDNIVRDQFKSAQIPSGFTVFDYFFDLKKEKVFKPWTQKV
jgi:dynein heavy chain